MRKLEEIRDELAGKSPLLVIHERDKSLADALFSEARLSRELLDHLIAQEKRMNEIEEKRESGDLISRILKLQDRIAYLEKFRTEMGDAFSAMKVALIDVLTALLKQASINRGLDQEIELDIPDPAPAAPRVRTCMELARYAAGIVEGGVNWGHAKHIAAARARDIEKVLRERVRTSRESNDEYADGLEWAADICAAAAAKDEGAL